METLPIQGATIVYVRPDYATWIKSDGDYDLVIEKPMSVRSGNEEYVIDPTDGKPDPVLLERLVGRTITKAEFDYAEGLRFETDDGTRYEVYPDEQYESWHCGSRSGGEYIIGVPYSR